MRQNSVGKKYMCVLRWEFTKVRNVIVRFPVILSM